MSEHLDDAMLFLGGDLLGADARAHLLDCSACRTRQRRLEAGRSVIDEIRRDSAPDVAWRKIDANVMLAAQQASADIRRGALRPSWRPRVMAYAGVAMAAAAALVFVMRQQHTEQNPSVTGGGPPHVATVTETQPAPVVVVPPPTVVAVVEPHVLLLAAPVSYASRGESPQPMTSHTIARAGGRVGTGEHTGRAVLSLHSGYRVDARAGTDIELASLTSDDTTMVLTKGEARVDGPMLDHGRVAMRAGEWTVLAKGGGFVTRIDGDSVRVRVILGKVHVSRNGSAEREVLAGDEIELGATAAEPRLIAHGATDPSAIDERLFAESGTSFDVPAAVAGATLTMDGIALPTGLTSMRLSAPRLLVARSGNEEWSLAVDPSATNSATAWHRARTIAFGAVPRVGDSMRAPVEQTMPTNAAATPVVNTAPPAAPTPTLAIAPLPPDPIVPGNSRLPGRQQLENELTARSASCYTECMALHSCGAGVVAAVNIDAEADGRVAAARVSGITSTAVSQCVENAARALRIPSFLRSSTVLLNVQPPQH